MQINKYELFIFLVAVFLTVSFVFYINHWENSERAIEAIKSYDIYFFNVPMTYFFGLAILFTIGDAGFIILPFIIFITAMLFLFLAFEKMPIAFFLTLFFMFLNYRIFSNILFFGRDNIQFLFFCVFTYLLSEVWLNKKPFIRYMLVISVLAMLNKSIGAYLLAFTLLFFVYSNYRTSLTSFFVAAIPIYNPGWFSSGLFDDIRKMAVQFMQGMKNLSIEIVFPNTAFPFAWLFFLIKPRFISFVIVLSTMLIGILIHNLNPLFYDYEVIWRYMFMFLPLNMLVIGYSLYHSEYLKGIKKIISFSS